MSPISIRHDGEDEVHQLSDKPVILSAGRIMRLGITTAAMAE
jgi:hypothetical protein